VVRFLYLYCVLSLKTVEVEGIGETPMVKVEENFLLKPSPFSLRDLGFP